MISEKGKLRNKIRFIQKRKFFELVFLIFLE